MSENVSAYDREGALKELLISVKSGEPIEDVLSNKLHTLSLKEQQKVAVDSITSSSKSGDTVGSLIAQSDLTAIRLMQMQLEMKLEERRMDKSYNMAEDKVKSVLGDQLDDLKELTLVTTEVRQRDSGSRWG